MSKLKITDVQVDCRELTQDQINKMYDIIKKEGYLIKSNQMVITGDWSYFSVDTRKGFGMHGFDRNQTLITYDEFINLFDKSEFKAEKAIKELEQRIALLEQKISEKEAENSVNEVANELPIFIEEGMMFKDIHSDKVYEIKDISHNVIELYILNESRNVYSSIIDIKNDIKQGLWILLPPTEMKESELIKGAICKFWNNYEDNYEIGRYEANLNEDEDTYIHVNILTLGTFKNAKVISIDEALQLFKKQLLNEN